MKRAARIALVVVVLAVAVARPSGHAEALYDPSKLGSSGQVLINGAAAYAAVQAVAPAVAPVLATVGLLAVLATYPGEPSSATYRGQHANKCARYINDEHGGFPPISAVQPWFDYPGVTENPFGDDYDVCDITTLVVHDVYEADQIKRAPWQDKFCQAWESNFGGWYDGDNPYAPGFPGTTAEVASFIDEACPPAWRSYLTGLTSTMPAYAPLGVPTWHAAMDGGFERDDVVRGYPGAYGDVAATAEASSWNTQRNAGVAANMRVQRVEDTASAGNHVLRAKAEVTDLTTTATAYVQTTKPLPLTSGQWVSAWWRSSPGTPRNLYTGVTQTFCLRTAAQTSVSQWSCAPVPVAGGVNYPTTWAMQKVQVPAGYTAENPQLQVLLFVWRSGTAGVYIEIDDLRITATDPALEGLTGPRAPAAQNVSGAPDATCTPGTIVAGDGTCQPIPPDAPAVPQGASTSVDRPAPLDPLPWPTPETPPGDNGVLDALSHLGDRIVGALSEVPNRIVQTLETWLGMIGDQLDQVLDMLEYLGAVIWDAAGRIIFELKPLLQSVADGVNRVRTAVADVASRVSLIPGQIVSGMSAALMPSPGFKTEMQTKLSESWQPSAPGAITTTITTGVTSMRTAITNGLGASPCGPAIGWDATSVVPAFKIRLPSPAPCPGNGPNGARTEHDDNAANLLGYRLLVRSMILFSILWGVGWSLVRSLPWVGRSDTAAVQ